MIGFRIKQLRKYVLEMTQKDFGLQIGLKPNSVSDIESGKNNPTEQTIKAICREFDVNETWLRTGEGAPQLPRTRSQVIMDFAADLIKDDNESFRRKIIEALAVLDTEDWEALETIANKLIKKD